MRFSRSAARLVCDSWGFLQDSSRFVEILWGSSHVRTVRSATRWFLILEDAVKDSLRFAKILWDSRERGRGFLSPTRSPAFISEEEEGVSRTLLTVLESSEMARIDLILFRGGGGVSMVRDACKILPSILLRVGGGEGGAWLRDADRFNPKSREHRPAIAR